MDSRRVFDYLFKDFYGFLVILGYPWGPIRRPKATLGGGNERTGFDSLPGGSPGAHFDPFLIDFGRYFEVALAAFCVIIRCKVTKNFFGTMMGNTTIMFLERPGNTVGMLHE